MAERSAQGADTRKRIMQAAADLFHKQGVHATSPDEVIEASHTGKGQFYHYFRNKEGLVHEVLQAHLEEIRTGTAPLNYEISSWQDLEQFFMTSVARQKLYRMTRGCPFGTIGNEITENDELIRQDLSLIFEVINNKLAAFFIQEKARGALLPGANPEVLADFCIATIQGATLMGKVRRNFRLVETTVREALNHLRQFATVPERAEAASD